MRGVLIAASCAGGGGDVLAAIEVVASVAADQSPQGIGVRFDAVDDGGPQRGQVQFGAAGDGLDLTFPRLRWRLHGDAGRERAAASAAIVERTTCG